MNRDAWSERERKSAGRKEEEGGQEGSEQRNQGETGRTISPRGCNRGRSLSLSPLVVGGKGGFRRETERERERERRGGERMTAGVEEVGDEENEEAVKTIERK